MPIRMAMSKSAGGVLADGTLRNGNSVFENVLVFVFFFVSVVVVVDS